MDIKLTTAVDVENPIETDLELVNGDFVWFVDPMAEAIQTLRARFEFFQGEWFLDKNEGTPWFQKLLGIKGLEDATIRLVFSKVILGSPGISSLDYLSIGRNEAERTYFPIFKARTIEGFVIDSSKLDPFVVRF